MLITFISRYFQPSSTLIAFWSHVILNEWLAFYKAFLNTHLSGVLAALFINHLVVTWLVPHETAAVSACSLLFVHHTIMHHVTSCKISRVHVCLAVTCHLHFLAQWPGSFTCCCGYTVVEWTLKHELAQKGDPGEEHSPATPPSKNAMDCECEVLLNVLRCQMTY